MPRPRKYDYQTDYPVTLHIKVPIQVVKELEAVYVTQTNMQKEIEKSKIVEQFLEEYAKNAREKS